MTKVKHAKSNGIKGRGVRVAEANDHLCHGWEKGGWDAQGSVCNDKMQEGKGDGVG